MKTRMLAMLGVIVALGLPMAAQATTLEGRLPTTLGGTDYQAYYDPNTNLTWLADGLLNGKMDWSNASSWADTLTITGYVGANSTGVGGWRLPTADTSCKLIIGLFGTNCANSEIGQLSFNTLGNSFGSASNTVGPFSNVQHVADWTATVSGVSRHFSFGLGSAEQINDANSVQLGALAVRASDPGAPGSSANSVPEPGSLWMMGAGLTLLGLGLARRGRLG